MIFNPYFEKRIDTLVVPMGCGRTTEFSNPSSGAEYHWCAYTMPHKVSTVDMLDEVSTSVQVAEPVTQSGKVDGRLVGDMFDGQGFVRGLARKGRPAKGASALIVGAGGVGSAIAVAMQKQRWDAWRSRYTLRGNRKLADRLQQFFPKLSIQVGSNDPAGFEIVVNATPMGMGLVTPAS